jgi:hypothetical protein
MKRILLDQGPAPHTAAILRRNGLDAVHVSELGMEQSASGGCRRESSAGTRRRRPFGTRTVMKKTTTKMVTMTMEEVRKRKIPKAEMERLKRLAAMPDEQIDTSDIPELTNFAGGVRGRFYRPLTQSVTIRLNAPDIEAASTLEGQRHALPDLHQGPAAPGAGARGEVGSCAEAQA